MSVKLNVDPRFLRAKGDNYVALEVIGNTVGECLSHFVKQQPTAKDLVFTKEGNLYPSTYVFVNKKTVTSDKLAKTVKDGDDISIIDGSTRGSCPCQWGANRTAMG